MYEVKPTDEGKTNSVKGWSIWLNSALKNAPQISIVLFVYIQSGNRTSLVAQAVKRLSTMRETWVWSLGWEDPLEKEMSTHSKTIAWKIHGQRSLVGYSPWGREDLDMTEQLHYIIF